MDQPSTSTRPPWSGPLKLAITIAAACTALLLWCLGATSIDHRQVGAVTWLQVAITSAVWLAALIIRVRDTAVSDLRDEIRAEIRAHDHQVNARVAELTAAILQYGDERQTQGHVEWLSRGDAGGGREDRPSLRTVR